MKMRKSQVFVLAAMLLLLVCALAVTAVAAGDFVTDSTGTILIHYTGTDSSVTIPSTVKTVGADAFKGNTDITNVTIPDSVTSMGAGAFEDCTHLTSIKLSTKLALIPARAFRNCADLKEIVIPRSVKTIGDEAFYGCVDLLDVKGPDPSYQGSTPYWPVPSYVTSIGTNAFGNCPKVAIQCFRGSATETYCNNNDLNKVVVDPIVYSIKATRSPFVIIWDKTNSAQVQLSVTVDPSFVSTDSLGYSIGDQSIVTVSATGLLTPVKPGTCSSTVYALKNLSVYTEIPIVVLNDQVSWQLWDGVWYYCKSRTEFAIGWQQIAGYWYYFNEAGQMQTGWQKIDGSWYYLGTSGAMATGWVKTGGKWYYMNAGGAMMTGWQQIGGYWFFFEPNNAATLGQMYENGSYSIGGVTYIFDSNGHLLSNSGWKLVGGKWYYYSGNGVYKGWLKDNGSWYFLNKTTGAMVTGWLNDGGTLYYMNSSGAMVTGWQKIGGNWYYFNVSGAMYTGWLKDGGYWYYLKSDGKMATGSLTIDGVNYVFAATGVWIK